MTFRNSVRLSEPINLKFMFPFICKLNWLYSSKTFGNCMELMHSTCFYVFKSKCENTILGVTISNWHLWEYTTINGLKLNFMFQCKLIASLAIQQLPEWKIFVGNEIERFTFARTCGDWYYVMWWFKVFSVLESFYRTKKNLVWMIEVFLK